MAHFTPGVTTYDTLDQDVVSVRDMSMQRNAIPFVDDLFLLSSVLFSPLNHESNGLFKKKLCFYEIFGSLHAKTLASRLLMASEVIFC